MTRSALSIGMPAGDCLHLAALLSGRVCHDLAGGLGTVVSSLHLAREAPIDDTEAVDLAREAAMELIHRLRLLRAAWGGDNEPLTKADLKRLSAGLGRGRLEVMLDGVDPGVSFGDDAARLVLNVMMLAADSLPRGGVLALQSAGPHRLLITIDGPGASWTPGLATCLVGPEAAWAQISKDTESQIGSLQCALTALIAHSTGLGISMLMARQAEEAPPLMLRLSRHAT